MSKAFHSHLFWKLYIVGVCFLGCERESNVVPSKSADSGPVEQAQEIVEASLADQMAAVERGESTRILVEQQPLDDQNLIALSKLPKLTDLLLDHPGGEFHPAGFAALAELPSLHHFRIRGSGIGNECLREIARIKSLRILNVPRGRFTDEGLTLLAELPQLEMLRFGSPRVTDEGIKSLTGFPALRQLHLIDVPITDAGLAELAKSDRFQSLYIDGGQITDAGWDDLFRRRPRLHVHVNQEHHDRDPNKHPH